MKIIEFITPNRDLATYLYKQGYTDHEITVRDGVKVWAFRIPGALKDKLKKDQRNFRM